MAAVISWAAFWEKDFDEQQEYAAALEEDNRFIYNDDASLGVGWLQPAQIFRIEAAGVRAVRLAYYQPETLISAEAWQGIRDEKTLCFLSHRPQDDEPSFIINADFGHGTIAFVEFTT